jgi:hypothetical protein
MAIAESFQNSATMTTTEFFLAANSTTQGAGQSTDMMVQLFLDVSALANADEYRVRAWDAISSAGTVRIIMEWTISHAQSEPIWASPALILLHKWDFSVTKLAGTDRSIAWSIRTAT